MKITFVLPYAGLAGGVRNIAQHAIQLQARGHEIFIVSTPQRPPPPGVKIISWIKGKGRPAVPETGRSHLDNIGVPQHRIERLRPIRDQDLPDADVVIATWWLTAHWVARLSASKGAKVYYIQDFAVSGSAWEQRKVIQTWKLPLYRIAVAEWLVKQIRAHCGEATPVSLAPCAVDADAFHAPLRSRQKIPTVGFTYRTETSKGADIALEAFRLAQKNIPELRLVICSSQQPRHPLPPNSTLYYQPPDEAIRQIYTRCDAWLFSSRWEGFGLPILEAMACRTPVIGTPAGAAPEILANGNGILLSSEQPRHMAEGIAHIFELSDAQWQALSESAYKKASDYTPDKSADLFEEALQTAINRWRGCDSSPP